MYIAEIPQFLTVRRQSGRCAYDILPSAIDLVAAVIIIICACRCLFKPDRPYLAHFLAYIVIYEESLAYRSIILDMGHRIVPSVIHLVQYPDVSCGIDVYGPSPVSRLHRNKIQGNFHSPVLDKADIVGIIFRACHIVSRKLVNLVCHIGPIESHIHSYPVPEELHLQSGFPRLHIFRLQILIRISISGTVSSRIL